MSFIESVRRSRDLLREEGRISLRALRREFGLDDEALDELVEELVDVQQVAVREGNVLAWARGSAASSSAPPVATESGGGPRDETSQHLAGVDDETPSTLARGRYQLQRFFGEVAKKRVRA